jgi:putative membrane protein
MYWDGADWWAWIPMSLFMIAFWGLLIWGVVHLVAKRQPEEPRPRTALQILDERLARGEIEIDEYRERRASLEGRTSDRETVGSSAPWR